MTKDCYCGAECWVDLAELQDEYGECQGRISVVDEHWWDEDFYWVHACVKHEETYWKIY